MTPKATAKTPRTQSKKAHARTGKTSLIASAKSWIPNVTIMQERYEGNSRNWAKELFMKPERSTFVEWAKGREEATTPTTSCACCQSNPRKHS